jgi:hypothetical protein
VRFVTTLVWLASCTSVLAGGETVGDQFRAVTPQEFANTFVGICVSNPGRLDKVGAIADALELADTPEPFWTLYAPQEAEAPYHSWFAIEGTGAPFVISISEAPFQEQIYQICSVSNPFMNANLALQQLDKFVSLNLSITDETVAGSRYRIWSAADILEGVLISANDSEAIGGEGITLSILAPKQY